MPEIAAFQEDVTGVSFKVNDVQGLVSAIASSINDTEKLNRWSQAAQSIVDCEYNTERMTERFTEMIKDIAESREGR